MTSPGNRSGAGGGPGARSEGAAFSDLRMFLAFQHMSDETLHAFACCGHELEVGRGHVVFAEGDAGADFFIVVAGAVEAARHSPLGPQVLLHANVGYVVGEESFVDGKARAMTATASDRALLLRLDAEAVRAAIAVDLGLAVDLHRALWCSLVGKLRHTNQLMTQVFTPGLRVAPVGSRATGESVELRPSAKMELLSERGLGAAELRLLAATLEARRYAAGSHIFFEGDRGDCLYIVVDGQVRISRQMPGMGEEALAILGRGGLFGEAALVDDQPRSADARAHDAGCTVLALSQADIDELLALRSKASLELVELLCAVLAARLRGMYDNLVSWRVMAGFG